MKRYLICCFLLVGLLLTGCGTSFDWGAGIADLEKAGYVILIHNDTAEELRAAEKLLAASIKLEGEETFDFELLETVGLTNTPDEKYPVSQYQFYQFATAEQAEQYQNYYISTRAETSQWKVARSKNTVVLSNQTDAAELLGMEFR